jgi:hypothetical protein
MALLPVCELIKAFVRSLSVLDTTTLPITGKVMMNFYQVVLFSSDNGTFLDLGVL